MKRIIALREEVRKVLPSLEELASKPVIENRDKREFMKLSKGRLREIVEDLMELNLIEPKLYGEITNLSKRNPKYLRSSVVRGILNGLIPYA